MAKLPKLKLLSTVQDFIRKVDPTRVNDEDILFAYCDTLQSNPRVFKTHLPISLFPPTLMDMCKVVYVARDPRDVMVSRFHYFRLMKVHDFIGTFDEFLNYLFAEELVFNPYWKHLEEAWNMRDHPNMLFLYYEDMKTDPLREYKKINEFLGTKLNEEQVQKIVDFTSFQNMKKRTEAGEHGQPMSDDGNLHNQNVKEKTGGFFRKGTTGDWKENYTQDQLEKFNKWIKTNTKDLPQDFPYILK